MQFTAVIKNKVGKFMKLVSASESERSQLEADWYAAWERKDFELFYQPVFDLETDRLRGFEVLLRWLHPTRGSFFPCQVLALAECELPLNELRLWAIEQVCNQLCQWQERFPQCDSLFFSLHFFESELLPPEWIEQVEHILVRTKINPDRLRLSFCDSHGSPIAAIAETPFRIQYYINDLTQGYSLLSNLYQCPVGILKINARFINSTHWTILEGLFNLASDLELEAIAEGIQTPEDRIRVKDIAGPRITGYIDSQALDCDGATTLVARDYRSIR